MIYGCTAVPGCRTNQSISNPQWPVSSSWCSRHEELALGSKWPIAPAPWGAGSATVTAFHHCCQQNQVILALVSHSRLPRVPLCFKGALLSLHPQWAFSCSPERLKLCFHGFIGFHVPVLTWAVKLKNFLTLISNFQIYPGSLLSSRRDFKPQELCSVITAYLVGTLEFCPLSSVEGSETSEPI